MVVAAGIILPRPYLPPAPAVNEGKNSLLRISHFYESLTTCTVSDPSGNLRKPALTTAARTSAN